MPFWVTNNQINQTALYITNEAKFSTKANFVTVCNRWVDQLFCRHQHRGSLHDVTRKLNLDQKCTWKTQMWSNSLFSQASWLFTPISNTFCIICCYYVCFGLLVQISLADYSAYLHELRVSCTLLSIIRSISGWFLNFKSLFPNSLPPLNLNKFSEYCIN